MQELENQLLDPPIDRPRLLDQCMDNLDFAIMLLEDFANSSQARLNDFDAVLSDRNFPEIATKAHALRGTSSILAIVTVPKICSDLEVAARKKNEEQTLELIQQLRSEVQRVNDFIPNIRESNRS